MNQDVVTPPDTLFVKQQMQRQRVAIADAQFDLSLNALAGSPLETPVMPGAAKRAGGGVTFADAPETPAGPQAPRTSGQVVSDILLYTNPPLTYVAAAAGALVLAGAWFATRGGHGVTLLTALAYLLLADLALNLFRSLVSKHWYESAGWADSDWAEAAAQRAAASVAALARLHDRYLMCRDPTVALKVAAGLWAVATLGHFLSMWSLAVLVYVTAFTLPAAYTAHREAVQRAYTGACASASARWEALGLSRKHKALALALALGCLWLRSGWNTRLVALLVGALAVRCQLKPAEVDRIIAIAEPYTQSVRKRASRMSVYAQDFALRTTGGKTHMR